MEEIEIKNFPELFKQIKRVNENYPGGLVYRGVVDYSNRNNQKKVDKLIPKIFREASIDSNYSGYIDESRMINGALSELPGEFIGMSNNLEILLKLQHYGIPTRLIDISFSPFISSFFACSLNEKQQEDRRCGFVYVIDKSKLEVKTVFSDTVAIVSSISRLDNQTKKWLVESLKQYLLIKINIIRFYLTTVEYERFSKYCEEYPLNDNILKDSLTINMERFCSNFFENGYNPEIPYDEMNSVEFIENIDRIENFTVKSLIERLEVMESVLLLYQLTMGAYGQIDISSLDSYQLHDQIYTAKQRLKKLFNRKPSVQQLLHEVRNFKPGFRDDLELEDLAKDYLIESLNSNDRIRNQQGGFILLGLQDNEEDYYVNQKIIIEKWKIPNEYMSEIHNNLNNLNINGSFIYPDLEHFNFGKYYKEQK